MANYLKISEACRFTLLSPELVRIRDDYEGAFKPDLGGQLHPSGLGTEGQSAAPAPQGGLHVRIAATHSGIITRNNGFYLPDKMRKGAPTFTQDYGKPVLLHHDDHADNVGRIIGSAYMDTSGGVIEQYDGLQVKNSKGKHVGTINEALIKDFSSGKMPFGQQVDVARSVLCDSLLEDNGYEGLGHIQVVANVADPVAIQKLLDGRYLTGSVGATTNRAVCSICRTDWTENGPCDHKPGGIYDDAKCFIIAGDLSYDEYSFVNVPADRHSKVLELHYNGIQDSIEVVNDHGRIYEVNLEFPQYDSENKEDNGMAKDAKNIQDSASTTPPDADQTEGQAEEVKDETVQTPETNEEVQTDVQDETTGEEDTSVQDDTETNVEDEASGEEQIEDKKKRKKKMKDEAVANLVTLLDAEELTDEQKGELYGLLWTEAEAAFADGEFTLEQLGVEKLEDAKLSDEDRVGLIKSSFCGPFPVTNAAHMVAVRRLLDHYNGEGDHSKILACVERKAKAIGFGAKKTEEEVQDDVKEEKTEDAMHHARLMHVILAALEENHYTSSDDPALTDDEKDMLAQILKRLASVVGKDNVQAVAVSEGLSIDPACEQALVDEVEKNEETIGSLRDQLSALRKEYNNLYGDVEALQDQLVQEKTKTRKVREEHLTTLVTLKDGKVSEDFNEVLESCSDGDLETRVTEATKGIDMEQILDKLGDGMSRTPEGVVENPTEVQDNSANNEETQKTSISAESLSKIQEEYLYLRLSRGEAVAEAYLTDQKRRGNLPRE